MRIEETGIPGAFAVTPHLLPDERGSFHEGLRADKLEQAIGAPFVPRQISYSVSRRNTLRGIHTVAVPPGQAKYVTCVHGALRDIIVDLRVGSPAFGRHHVCTLDARSGRSLYIPDGVGHGFLALADDTRICYVMSTVYAPGTQIDIDPFDPELALPWEPDGEPLMSKKDTEAPGLAATLAAGALPTWQKVGA
ncbi:dTDP-4-dehydrorhamnose 3,5-epimerase family protein [Streptomyces bacillaris]|uniref:dTDP-4-dehydrorhamnose 3,5-epimerase family protein n=1 Tax=Streptomyces cavourensis TaxID=67258 RepID=A0AAD0VGL6_9ACTN|nr:MULTISPECIES: dTDP-4-dehydrorhamnose 3,5-epimerase family protein [Streptomyces]NUW21646.1 dTDP-4-keto-6-deoxy-D-glucose epimerase [Streptomyces roseoviolaceus]ATY98269.1 dTDP-4-dehydrorhamnose 3,5-epimerase [Streptomyces cavourensis]AXI74108.1 dTDP-4-keto-6-deoxy-D-glucose epimerase [Streptomyces cavourensis]MBH0243751.1 dTDP-4-dehydrorhamnose 3,5-epimerase family protein [Streptomyces cavourensis]NUV40581.1 dTDP-4-keto-6-deoxy-D-glucose epimerase [Streptomyces sp. CAI-24]